VKTFMQKERALMESEQIRNTDLKNCSFVSCGSFAYACV
jgi:hypothetical protein